VAVARALRQDSWFFIRAHPADYLRRVEEGGAIFLQTTNHNAELHDNRERLAGLESFYNTAVRPGGSALPLFLTLLAALLIAGQAVTTRATASPLARNDLLAAFLLGSVLWVVLAGTFLEHGENNRFRFGIDPLVCVLLVAGLAHARRAEDSPAA
jgi:hypothetical protein